MVAETQTPNPYPRINLWIVNQALQQVYEVQQKLDALRGELQRIIQESQQR